MADETQEQQEVVEVPEIVPEQEDGNKAEESKVEEPVEIIIESTIISCPTANTAPFANRSKPNYYSPLALNKMECWMCGMSHKRRRKNKHTRRNIVESWMPTEQEVAAPAVAQAN